MPFTHRDGVRLYWRLNGPCAAPAMVLLHSIGTDMAIYDRVLPLLEPDFLLLRLDIRGHGASEASEGDYTLSQLGADLAAVMDDAGIRRAIVCGISLGGMIAMQFVQDAPDRVAGLALACTSAGMNPALWPERIATVRAHGMAGVADGWVSRHSSPEFVAAEPAVAETMTRALEGMSPDGYLGCAAAIRDMDVVPGLGRVAVPTVVIAGERDVATPFAGHGDRIAAAIPGATVALLPAAHLACIEQPSLFAGCLRALAARCA